MTDKPTEIKNTYLTVLHTKTCLHFTGNYGKCIDVHQGNAQVSISNGITASNTYVESSHIL